MKISDPHEERGLRIRSAISLRGHRKMLALAVELGVSVAAISKWQKGQQISLENACILAQHLDVSLDWLLLARGSPDWHRSRALTDDELDLVLQLRSRPKPILKILSDLVKQVPSA